MSRMINDAKRLDVDADSKCQVYNIPDDWQEPQSCWLMGPSETEEIMR